MASCEALEFMRNTESVEDPIQLPEFRKIEVLAADGHEQCERDRRGRLKGGRKAGATGNDSCNFPLQGKSDQDGRTRAAGKTGEINPLRIQGESRSGIGYECVDGVFNDLDRTVPRIVGTRENVSVFLCSILEALDGQRSPCARIESEQDRPLLIRGVAGWQIEGIGLSSIAPAGDFFDESPSGQVLGRAQQADAQRNQQQREQIQPEQPEAGRFHSLPSALARI